MKTTIQKIVAVCAAIAMLSSVFCIISFATDIPQEQIIYENAMDSIRGIVNNSGENPFGHIAENKGGGVVNEGDRTYLKTSTNDNQDVGMYVDLGKEVSGGVVVVEFDVKSLTDKVGGVVFNGYTAPGADTNRLYNNNKGVYADTTWSTRKIIIDFNNSKMILDRDTDGSPFAADISKESFRYIYLRRGQPNAFAVDNLKVYYPSPGETLFYHSMDINALVKGGQGNAISATINTNDGKTYMETKGDSSNNAAIIVELPEAISSGKFALEFDLKGVDTEKNLIIELMGADGNVKSTYGTIGSPMYFEMPTTWTHYKVEVDMDTGGVLRYDNNAATPTVSTGSSVTAGAAVKKILISNWKAKFCVDELMVYAIPDTPAPPAKDPVEISADNLDEGTTATASITMEDAAFTDYNGKEVLFVFAAYNEGVLNACDMATVTIGGTAEPLSIVLPAGTTELKSFVWLASNNKPILVPYASYPSN